MWTFNLETVSSIEERDINPNAIIAYPNPARDQITLSENIKGFYRLLDFQGREIQSGNARGQSINISELHSGTYILLLQDHSGSLYTQKVIKK